MITKLKENLNHSLLAYVVTTHNAVKIQLHNDIMIETTA